MPRTKSDTTDADIAAFMKYAGKAPAAKEEAAPAEAAPSKPAIAPNVSGLPDPLGDLVRGGTGSLFGRHTLGRHLTDEEMNWAQRAGRGINKGLAGDVVGARSLAGRISGVNEMLHSIPESAPLKRAYRSIKGVSEQPDTSITETVGRVGGAAAPFVAMEPLIAGAAGTVGAAGTAAGMAPRAASWLETAIKTAGGAGVGGLAGAVQTPENPEAGALPGMIGGAAGPITGAVTRSPIGKFVGGMAVPESIYYGIHHATGVPYYPFGAAIVWHSSPIGKRLRRVGSKIIDELGRLVGEIPSGVTGTAAGQAVGGATDNTEGPLSTQRP